jgi:hypothetical protein
MLYPSGKSQGILNESHWIHAARELMSCVGIRDLDSYCPSEPPPKPMPMMGGMPVGSEYREQLLEEMRLGDRAESVKPYLLPWLESSQAELLNRLSLPLGPRS